MKEKRVPKVIPETGAVTALGMMSGTSLDGVDAAILQTDGTRILGFGPTCYRPYSAAEQSVLKAALGQWSGPAVEAAAHLVTAAHLDLLQKMPAADVIGFHGQTVAHAPRGPGTLQVGDGARIAQDVGIPVVWDFRSADIALGGEGAPLAPFYHFACANFIGAEEPLGFLNLGGVGNLTIVNPRFDRPEKPGALLSFDTGPANAPLNDLMQLRRGVGFDAEGALAAQGKVDAARVAAFVADPYFERLPPKSLDRNDFPRISELVDGLTDADAAATLTAFCAAAVARGIKHLSKPPSRILATGGGRLNPVLMQLVKETTGCPVEPVETVGLDGDMLEAQAFAHLAVRVLRDLPTSCAGTTGVVTPVCGGQKSLPGGRGQAEQG